MHSFDIGDKVQLAYDPSGKDAYVSKIRDSACGGFYNESLHAGDTGTVVEVYDEGRAERKRVPWCKVQWDVEPNLSLHTCGGKAPNGTGWNVPEAMLIKCNDAIELDLNGFDPFAIL